MEGSRPWKEVPPPEGCLSSVIIQKGFRGCQSLSRGVTLPVWVDGVKEEWAWEKVTAQGLAQKELLLRETLIGVNDETQRGKTVTRPLQKMAFLPFPPSLGRLANVKS